MKNPVALITNCFVKIPNGLTFLVPDFPGCPGKEAAKRVCVRNVVSVFYLIEQCLMSH